MTHFNGGTMRRIRDCVAKTAKKCLEHVRHHFSNSVGPFLVSGLIACNRAKLSASGPLFAASCVDWQASALSSSSGSCGAASRWEAILRGQNICKRR
jgi:hypothetical protein